MKTAKKALCIIMVLLVLMSCVTFGAAAVSRPPYNGYTYNVYGQAVAAPVGYVPDDKITYQDMGTTALKSPSDMFIYNDGEQDLIFITDTGNNRIVILDADYKFVREIKQFTDADGNKYDICSPKGIFVFEDTIYVTNTRIKQNEKGDSYTDGDILVGDLEGNFVDQFFKPVAATVDIVHFDPLSVVVDKSGYVYVRAYGVLDGLIVYDMNGEFVTFYGANPVELTFDIIVQRIWKSIFSREAADQLLKAVPTEMSNIFVDEEGFIYTSTESTAVAESLRIRKLNAAGKNILTSDPNALVKTVFGDRVIAYLVNISYTTRLVDVHVDGNDIIAALDARRGRVFLYDQNSYLLTIFGAQGTQFGATSVAVALGKLGDKYVILDQYDGSLNTYAPTEFMEKLLIADAYYMTGRYVEGEPYWQTVLLYDANNARAYAAIGKSLLEQEKYGEALEYLKLGEDRTSYSTALSEYRTQYLRDNWMWLLPAVVVAVVIISYLYKFIRKILGLKNEKKKVKFN